MPRRSTGPATEHRTCDGAPDLRRSSGLATELGAVPFKKGAGPRVNRNRDLISLGAHGLDFVRAIAGQSAAIVGSDYGSMTTFCHRPSM